MKQPTSLQTLKNQVQNAQELKKENQLLKLPLVFRDAFIVPNGTSGFEQLLHQAAVLEVLIPPLCSHHCCFSPPRASRFPAKFSSFVLSVLLNLLSQCFSFVLCQTKLPYCPVRSSTSLFRAVGGAAFGWSWFCPSWRRFPSRTDLIIFLHKPDLAIPMVDCRKINMNLCWPGSPKETSFQFGCDGGRCTQVFD